MLVTLDQRTVFGQSIFFLLTDIDKLDIKVYVFILGFLSQNAHDFLNGVPNVENFVIVPKLIRLDLGEVQHILYDKVHQLSWILLDYPAFIELLQNLYAFLKLTLLSGFGVKL